MKKYNFEELLNNPGLDPTHIPFYYFTYFSDMRKMVISVTGWWIVEFLSFCLLEGKNSVKRPSGKLKPQGVFI